MKVRLAIFDLDGTLVDTSEDITAAINHATGPLGFRALEPVETEKLVGEGLSNLIDKVLRREDHPDKQKALADFLDYYSANLSVHSRPYPHVVEALEGLGPDMLKAVVSNKREALSRRLLEELGLAGHFNIIVGGDTVARKKPSPVPIQHVLSCLNIMPEEAVLIGDSLYDIAAGTGAGIKTVAVTYGYGEKEDLSGADFMIYRMRDLPPLLMENPNLLERRKEQRHSLPDIYHKYVDLKVRVGKEFVPVTLLDFSRNGIRTKGYLDLAEGSLEEFIISAPRSITKEVGFKARVRYCFSDNNAYVMGAEIEEVDDEVWFRIFEKVHDFILKKPYFHDEEE